MSTQEYVLKTFLIYIFVKALVFMPLAWIAFLAWWNDRHEETVATAAE